MSTRRKSWMVSSNRPAGMGENSWIAIVSIILPGLAALTAGIYILPHK